MKKLLCVLVAAFSLTAFAAKTEKFEARKKTLIEHVSKRIAVLNEQKTCLTNAKAQADIKKCHQDSRTKMKAMSSERKASRAKMKEQRKAKKAKSE